MIDERDFLTAILEHPDDDVTKLVYADWLEEHDDPRGEYLRLMVKVRQERKIAPEHRQRRDELAAEVARLRAEAANFWTEGAPAHSRAQRMQLIQRSQQLDDEAAQLSREIRQKLPPRLQELAATFDPQWLATVSDPEIEGCGKVQDLGLRFEFICDKTWAELTPTDKGDVRHCLSCSKNVHYCDNLADAREHAEHGRCISVDLGIIRRDGDLVSRFAVLGQPSADYMRRINEEDIDPVSRARLDARKGKKQRRR